MNTVELVSLVKDIGLSQELVKTVTDGDVYENWNTTEIKYGAVNIGIQNISYQSQQSVYNLILYYGDRLEQDKSNLNSIYTDGLNALQSIINILYQLDNVDIDDNVLYTPFEQKFADYLAGVYCSVAIRVDSSIGLCSVDEYNWKDDKDEIIERLREEIAEYKTKDEQLLHILEEIIYKLLGE